MTMNKSTADLDAELAALSDRAEALSAELQRRQEIERAWKAGKKIEWAWPSKFFWAPMQAYSGDGSQLTWHTNDYRIAPEAPQAPDAFWVNLDSFGPARTPGGYVRIARIAFPSREEACKAVPGTPEDRIVRYTRETACGGLEMNVWVKEGKDPMIESDAPNHIWMTGQGWKLIRVREVKT